MDQTGDPADRLEVVVTLRLPISRAAWEMNYGVGGTRAIQADVKQYVSQGVWQQLEELGLLAADR